jgi:hypothetical protein
MAQEYIGQIEMFYGAMAWYLDHYPRNAHQLLADLPLTASEAPPPRSTGRAAPAAQESAGSP